MLPGHIATPERAGQAVAWVQPLQEEAPLPPDLQSDLCAQVARMTWEDSRVPSEAVKDNPEKPQNAARV
jgi:hypothetical protein